MSILLLFGFEGGEETGRPISFPPPKTIVSQTWKYVFFLDKYLI